MAKEPRLSILGKTWHKIVNQDCLDGRCYYNEFNLEMTFNLTSTNIATKNTNEHLPLQKRNIKTSRRDLNTIFCLFGKKSGGNPQQNISNAFP